MKNFLQSPFKKSRITLILLGVLATLLSGCAIAITGFVWLDENGNGVQDVGEPGVPGVQVRILDSSFTTVTSADGSYAIQWNFDLCVPCASNNEIEFIPPAGYIFTLQDQGDNGFDSDVDPDDGRTGARDNKVNPGIDHGQFDIDAGLILSENAEGEPGPEQQEGPTATPTPTPTPAPGSGGTGGEQACYGPLASEFPEGVSPLSGLAVTDPTLLDYRPVFLSISIFPPSVRPPTGLAASPIIYQLYIGDGDTRLMAGFYGEFPRSAFEGSEGEGSPPPTEFKYLIGDRVWFDANGNHLQDEGEPGVPDVPVRLVDANGTPLQTTETDAQGNYYFALNEVTANTAFQLRFGAPPSFSDYYWVNKDMGDDRIDSDVTGLGYTDLFDPTDEDESEQLNFDAGLRQAVRIEGLRSGRVAYQDLQVNYCGCLVTAGADPTVAQQINTCGTAFSDDPTNIGGAGLDVTRLQGIAANNTTGACAEPNLSGNLFCQKLPAEFSDGGQNGQELLVEYNVNNMSHFVYDGGSAAYLWELSVPGTRNFEVMTDRLTGENLTFENVVVLVVPHTAQNEAVTIINLSMKSARGPAYLFRNGQMFELEWSTQFPSYITDRDQPIPVHFELNGEPFPLAPGQTFINLVNVTGGLMSMIGEGSWRADFDAPSFP